MDKQKKIEELKNELCWLREDVFEEIANLLYAVGYRKIPEGAVIIPKELSCYDYIEKEVRTFRLDEKKVDFTEEQIMALTQIWHFKEKSENEIRKETAEKFAESLKTRLEERKKLCLERCKRYEHEGEGELACYWNGKENEIHCVKADIYEICKEITEGMQ